MHIFEFPGKWEEKLKKNKTVGIQKQIVGCFGRVPSQPNNPSFCKQI